MEKTALFGIVMILITLVSGSCQDVYNFILDTNWHYNSEDLENNNISNEDIYNYPRLCQILKNEPELPKKPPIPHLVIYRNNTENCTEKINAFFDFSIPLPAIEVGDLHCNDLNKLKWFVKLEKIGTYEIKGIKVWLILPITLLFIIFSFFRLIFWSKENQKIYKQQKPL